MNLRLLALLLLLLQSVDSCLVVHINMNGCKCPEIKYATRNDILGSPYSSHLADRPIQKPEQVTVRDDCQVRVAPGITPFKSFYFMIFRDSAPPIFERKFLFEVPYGNIFLDALTCEETDGTFEWHYYGGKVNNMLFALQSNDGNCGCKVWTGVTLMREEYCDMFTVQCQNPSHVIYFWDYHTTANYWLSNQPSAEVVDATCVGNNWYYNGIRLEAYEPVDAWCSPPETLYSFDPEVAENYCGCKEMRKMTNNYMPIFDTENVYNNFSLATPTLVYGSESQACTPKVSCPSGTVHVAFFSRNLKELLYSPDSIPSIQCQLTPLTVTNEARFWWVDGVMLFDTTVACLADSCPCDYKYLDDTNIGSLIGSHPFYQNISSYFIRSPEDNCGKACPNSIECAAGYSLVVLDSKTETVYLSGSASPICSNRKWTVEEIDNADRIYAVCVNFSAPTECACDYTYLDETNIPFSLLTHPFYQNFSSYPIRSPDDYCGVACPNSIECPSGYSLVVLDDTSSSVFQRSISPSCSNKKWSIEGSQFDQISAICVNFSAPVECACEHGYLDASNIASLVGNHPFYQNVTSYPTRTPDDLCDGGKCPSQVDCPAGYTLVVFDKSDAKLYPSGSLNSPSCSLQSKTWNVEGIQLETLYSICVNYSSPMLPCNCSFTFLDESTIFKYPHENVTQYPVRSPEESCGEYCPNEIVCAAGLTLTTLEQDGMFLYPSGINPICVASSNQWYIEDRLVVHADGLLTTCVNFSAPPQKTCQCEYKFLEKTDIASILRLDPFYVNVTSHPIRTPEDFCDNGGCPGKVECAEGYSVVIFDTEDTIVYNSESVAPRCDGYTKKWSIENDEDINRLFAVCVKFPDKPETIAMNGCQCPQIEWMDKAGIRMLPMASYLWERSTFYPASVSVSDQCDVTVDVTSSEYDNYHFMIFSTNLRPIFAKRVFPDNTVHAPLTLEPLGLRCQQVGNEYQWQYHGGEVKNMSFALQSNEDMCKCQPFPGSTPLEAGICDVFKIQCPQTTDVAYLHWKGNANDYEYLLPDTHTNIIYEATCQSNTWHYMGLWIGIVGNWEVLCKSPQSIMTSKRTTYNYQCGCRELQQITAYNGFMELYDGKGRFKEYGMSLSTVEYQDCAPVIGCKKSSDVLVLFGRHILTEELYMTYSPSSPPPITCGPSPQSLSVNPNASSVFWFIDGMMLSDPAFVCLTPP